MIRIVIGRSGRERSAVASRLGAHLNAVVVDGALELSWDRGIARGPDLHDVLAGRATPIEAVCEDGSVAILPCGRPIEKTPHTGLVAVLEALEREYGTVLIDYPSTVSSGVVCASHGAVLVTTPSVALSDLPRTRRLSRTIEEGIVATALLGSHPTTAAAIERLERMFCAPVTPVPAVPTVTALAVDDPVQRSIQRAFRRLAAHASVRS